LIRTSQWFDWIQFIRLFSSYFWTFNFPWHISHHIDSISTTNTNTKST
jgi:hypothetical protein